MRHIEINGQGEAVKRFFLSLSADPNGSAVELDGRLIARVFPAAETGHGSESSFEPWTETKNKRRCDLVDKEIDGQISAEEAAELEGLRRQMDRHLRNLAPLPIEDARRLRDELLAKAEALRKQ